jgi:hypothetical protein
MATKKKAPSTNRTTNKVFQARWTELTGKPFSSRNRATAALISSLSTLTVRTQPAVVQAPGPNAVPIEITTNVRRKQGTGCAQKAEIGAFYKGDITVVGVLGKVAVLAILNAAAAAECCGKQLDCPKECPCNYTPQNALGFYTVVGTSEIGALLQAQIVWNCECLKVQA